jgi:hypothetical protein
MFEPEASIREELSEHPRLVGLLFAASLLLGQTGMALGETCVCSTTGP